MSEAKKSISKRKRASALVPNNPEKEKFLMRKLKVALALVMTCALLAVGLPVTAAETDPVCCKIGDVGYTSVKEAMKAAQDDDVIDLITNTNLTSKYTITKKIEITSSNNSRIAITNTASFIIGNKADETGTPGELTLSGNLRVVANTGDADGIFFIKNGTLNIKDEVNCKTSKMYIIDSDSSGKVPVYINISGGTLESEFDKTDKGAVYVGGTGSVVNMTGGAVIQKNSKCYAFKIAGQGATLNISGGHVQAVNNTLAIHTADMNKTINITGGIVEAVNSTAIYTFSKCDYLTVNISDNALLKAKTHTVRLESPMSTVNMTGGTVIATEDAPISMGWGTMKISGGTVILEGNKTSANIVKSAFNKSKNFPAFVTISGGLFINNNPNNRNAMTDAVDGTKPITLTGGKVLYKENIKYVMENKISAPKTTQTTYGGESYYVYSCFGGAEEEYAGVMSESATVRLADGGNGIRFSAKFSEDVVKALGKKGNVTYGMLIVPTAYLTNLKEFTVEALTEKYGENGYLNVACTEGKGLVTLTSGDLRLQAAIVNIKADNYGTAFSAVAYAKAGDVYYYADFDQSRSSATVKDLAAAALADGSASYTASQTAVLNGFAS